MNMPDLKNDSELVTIVIPTHNRIKFLCEYLEQGRWDDLRLHIVCDGCDAEVVDELQSHTASGGITLQEEKPQQGVAHAIKAGIHGVKTPYVMFCGDDDYFVKPQAFLAEAVPLLQERRDVFMVIMPEVTAFTDRGLPYTQYERRVFHQLQGEELLYSLVREGEMSALLAGSLFRTKDMADHLPPLLFTVSEDFVLLARLCAAYPEHIVWVADHGRYMRRIHPQSLSARQQFSPEKGLLGLLGILVGGYHLEKLGLMDRDELAQTVMQRGETLQESYGVGTEMARVLSRMLTGEPAAVDTEEGAFTVEFLHTRWKDLPREIRALFAHVEATRYART